MIPTLTPAAPAAGLALLLLVQAAPSGSRQTASALTTWQGEVPAIQKRALPVREASAKVPAALYAKALEHEARSAGSKQRDANRKPAEVLAFYGIAPGMTVLDINSSAGYYTEILAGIVGEEGKVWSQNTQVGLDQWSGADFKAMLERNTGRPIASLVCNPGEIAKALAKKSGEAESLDAALIVRNYHDYPNMGVDLASFNKAVFAALKPGGLYGVVDHHAPRGTGLEHCQDLHRIDAETVIEQVTAAGFEFEAESNCLANPDDTHDWFIWKERGAYSDTTDRFVFRFRKPLPAEEPGSSE